jgi:branched-chain amino acid transport system substrate-binding protein
MLVSIIILAAGGGALYYFYMVQRPAKPVEEEVRIGALWPMTGSLAASGKDDSILAKIMVDDYNAAGGVKSLGGAKIRLIIKDTESKPEVARVEARRLITEQNVHVIIGCVRSGDTLPASEEAERLKTPFVVDASSHKDITERGFKYIVRPWLSDETVAKGHLEFLKWLEKKSGITIKTISICFGAVLFCEGVAELWKKYAVQYGYEIANYMRLPEPLTDATSEAEIIKNTKPDMLFLCCTPVSDAILWVQTLKRIKYYPKGILTTDGFGKPEYIMELGKDSLYGFAKDPYSATYANQHPKGKDLLPRFEAAAGKPFWMGPAGCHAAITTIFRALERVHSLDREEIMNALKTTELTPADILIPWKGVKFDEKGQNIYAFSAVTQVLPPEPRYYLVWPEEFAEKPVVFPVPDWDKRG